jgi:hypothetical protein
MKGSDVAASVWPTAPGWRGDVSPFSGEDGHSKIRTSDARRSSLLARDIGRSDPNCSFALAFRVWVACASVPSAWRTFRGRGPSKDIMAGRRDGWGGEAAVPADSARAVGARASRRRPRCRKIGRPPGNLGTPIGSAPWRSDLT